MPNNQALLKRRPGLTQEEFSNLWYNHATIVAPMFLFLGVQYYAQIHGPLTPTSETSTLDISSWAGAAEKPPSDSSAPDPQWLNDYYREVVMVDEKRFLDREAAEWFKRVDPGTVDGDRRIIIDGGKSLIEIPEEVMSVWIEYQKQGVGEK